MGFYLLKNGVFNNLYNIIITFIGYSCKLTPTWADGGVGTGEHPPKEVRFEDDNVPPIPLWPNFWITNHW